MGISRFGLPCLGAEALGGRKLGAIRVLVGLVFPNLGVEDQTANLRGC